MMKENKYDDQTFFTKYSEMTRSQKRPARSWGMADARKNVA